MSRENKGIVIMLRRDGKVREIWGRKFKIVRDGLDETEVFAFVGRLIEQNSELSSRLEHLDSLKRLAENAVIEANKQAESIKIETSEEANQKAKGIIIQAEEQTKAEAERIIAEAEQSSLDRIAASEQLAQDMLEAAEEEARAQPERIYAEADQQAKAQAEEQTNAEAERIIAEAEQNSLDRISAAEQLAQDMLEAAEEKAEEIKRLGEEEASRIIVEAKGKIEEEAALIGQETEHPLPASGKIAESEIRELANRVLEEFLSNSKATGKTTTRSTREESRAPQPSGTEAGVRAPADTVGQELHRQTSLGQEEGEEKESPALYRGTVEVAIPPPVAMSKMLKVHKRLTKTHQINVLDVAGSAGKGIVIRLFLRSPTPLIDMLEKLPEVEEATATMKQAAKTYPPQHRAGEPAVSRIVVTIKR